MTEKKKLGKDAISQSLYYFGQSMGALIVTTIALQGTDFEERLTNLAIDLTEVHNKIRSIYEEINQKNEG